MKLKHEILEATHLLKQQRNQIRLQINLLTENASLVSKNRIANAETLGEEIRSTYERMKRHL
jgi:hypothetical protein